MIAMPRFKQIQILSLQWQVSKYDPKWLASIGITLTNGSSSPIFTGLKKEELAEIKEIKITEQIKTIVGKKYSNTTGLLRNLSFKNNKDQSISCSNIPKCS